MKTNTFYLDRRSIFLATLAGAAAVAMLVSGCRPGRRDAIVHPATSSATTSHVRLVDIADRSDLNYRWSIDAKHPYNILQTIGNGCAFLDYNNDGNLDILLVGRKLALYQGDGRGGFVDVTPQVGLDRFTGDFRGCAVGDYDNDGYEDLYISAYRGGILFHNDHGQKFTDVTKSAGIAEQPWGTSCAFVDIDNDGRLDLYVGNYVKFGPQTQPQLCANGSIMTACGPVRYDPEYGVLYRNLGGGKFEDVTKKLSADKTSGKVLGVATADYDGSGRQSIYLANDEEPGNLLQNRGGQFKDVGASSGTAYDANANKHGGMGVDWGDYDNDGRLDLLVTTFEYEPKCVYHNDEGLFTEESAALGIAQPTVPYVAFGAKWGDFDNDGWLDMIIANGHIQDNASEVNKNTTYRQPVQVFHNDHGQRFVDVSSSLTGPAGRPIVGRGVAIGDFDNDGKVDALIVDCEGKPMLLHNETPQAGHWLLINLVGTKSNRDAQGALVTVEAGGSTLLRQCTTGGSYLSASDKRVHFGLGKSHVAEKITVQWPSGGKSVYTNVSADRIITLKEGANAVQSYPEH